MPQSTIPIHPVTLEFRYVTFLTRQDMPVRKYRATHRGTSWTLYQNYSGEWFEDCLRCPHATVAGMCTWCANERIVRLASSETGVRRALRTRNETNIVAEAHAGRVRQVERWAREHHAVACGLARVRARLGPYANADNQLVSLALNAARAPLNPGQTILACALLTELEATS